MAISYKGFNMYYCDPTTFENVQYCGKYELAILTRVGNWPSHNVDSLFYNLMQVTLPDIHAATCKGFFTEANVENNYFRRVQGCVPLMTLFESVCPSNGLKLKLVANNGSYAVSNDTFNAGARVFSTSSLQAERYTIYDADNNQIATQIPLTSHGGGNTGFLTLLNYEGGDIPQGRTLRFAVIGIYSSSDLTVDSSSELSTNLQAVADWLNAITPLIPPDTDPYNNLPVGGSDPIPGGGTVGIPNFPGLTATSAGVIGLFAPTAAQMQLLADYMWTDFGGTGTTVVEVLQELVEAIKRTISNPLDYIIGLNIIPSQGLSIGASKTVRFGFTSSGVSMPVLANQYFTVDCGTLAFDTLCGDTFLDYAPYSKFSIYLPYIGFKDVDPNDFVGHTIGVVYHGDCVTGGVTAYITKDGSVMYQYSGCCALNVPLSADNWGETISAAINVATGIVAAAASGGAAGLATGALKGAASVAANPSLLSPQVNHSGAVSGGAGCMGVQYPFVIREAVNFHSTAGFNKSAGYPAFYYKKLSDVTGYTTVIDAHMSGIPMATQDEIQEIESLLEGGVIL